MYVNKSKIWDIKTLLSEYDAILSKTNDYNVLTVEENKTIHKNKSLRLHDVFNSMSSVFHNFMLKNDFDIHCSLMQ